MRLPSFLSFVFLCSAVAALACASPGVINGGGQAWAQGSATQEKPIQLAQVKIQFGGSQRDFVRSLSRQGYSQIQVIKSGLSSLRFQACYEGSRYIVKVKRFTGQIRRGAKIGECRPALTEAALINKLRREGFRRISIYSSEADLFKLVACKRGARFRMEINPYGDTLRQDEVGSCQTQLNLTEARQKLRDNGYNRIRLVRENDRVYVFEACVRRSKNRVRMRKNGVIARTRRIGRCEPPIRFQQLPELMAKNGYDRVVVVDKQLPVYVAEGCDRNLKLVRVKFNRFGDVRGEKVVGECDPPLTRDDIVKNLREGGANRIVVDEQNADGIFVATSCHNLRKYRSTIDKYGKLLGQKVIGRCPPAPRMNEVVDRFERRNLNNVKIFVEGCRRGRQIRLRIDEFGDVLDRERVGSC